MNIFGNSKSNKIARNFSFEVEQSIFDEHSKLKYKDIETLVQMSKIFKTEALSDREKYHIHYKNFLTGLEILNKSKHRNYFIP